MSERYYRQEYSYLVEEGREFALRYPDLGRLLNLTDARGREPNVERLLEGFAFLTGRIRQRLDDDFPELAQGILDLLWPHLGKPVPSVCLMSFRFRMGQVDQGILVPAGSLVESDTLEEGLRCRFRTVAPLWVPPFSLTAAKSEGLGTVSRLRLDFKAGAGVVPHGLAGHPVRVQLFGELPVCLDLFNLLLGREGKRRYLSGVRLSAKGGKEERSWDLPPETLTPAGLSRQDSLLAGGENQYHGFSMMRDYFVFPEKYLAFNLHLGNHLSRMTTLDSFSLELKMDHPWPTDLTAGADAFRLGVVPAVNLFSVDGEPIRLNHERHSYRVRVDLTNPRSYQVYSVDRVEGVRLADGQRRMYQPLYAVRHILGGRAEGLEGPFYVSTSTAAPWGGMETSLSVADPSGRGALPEEETLSLSLTCFNGTLASRPGPGRISQPLSGVPENLLAANLGQPTSPVYPESRKHPAWSWLGAASLNYLSLTSVPRLQSLLSLFLPGNDEANARRLSGIERVGLAPIRERVRGALAAGRQVTVALNEEFFSGAGDLQVFALVLSRFLATHASINSFLRLKVVLEPSGRELMMDPSLVGPEEQ